jgi:hypothetical protein
MMAPRHMPVKIVRTQTISGQAGGDRFVALYVFRMRLLEARMAEGHFVGCVLVVYRVLFVCGSEGRIVLEVLPVFVLLAVVFD